MAYFIGDWNNPGTEKIYVQEIKSEWLTQKNTQLHVARFDMVHPEVSGNKWFKLKYYLQEAINQGCRVVATFGGAFSNHIVAMAYACNISGLKSIGIIRGEKSPHGSQTLLKAEQYGMDLHFVTRSLYKNKDFIKKSFKNTYWINEGGYGIPGARGAKDMLNYVNAPEKYSHFVCAVGTGTMTAGLVQAAGYHQKIIGVSIMRNNHSLIEKIRDLLSLEDEDKQFRIVHDYHFGGYAKHPQYLLDYINETWQQHQLPTDIVYTGKTFFATEQMIDNNTIPPGSNVLMIHSGGLQGNLSLSPGTLCF